MRFSYNNKVDSKKLDKIVNALSSPFVNKNNVSDNFPPTQTYYLTSIPASRILARPAFVPSRPVPDFSNTR